ncbi:hypothetical protein ABZ543_13115 [Streptomyces roseifaciens]
MVFALASSTNTAELVANVQNDPVGTADTVRKNVRAFMTTGNVSMMGGWTDAS